MKNTSEKTVADLEKLIFALNADKVKKREVYKKEDEHIDQKIRIAEAELTVLKENNRTTILGRRQILMIVQYACKEYKVLKSKMNRLSYSFLCRVLLKRYTFVRKNNEPPLQYGQLISYIKKYFALEISTIEVPKTFVPQEYMHLGLLFQIP